MTLEHFLSISVPRAPPPQHGMLSSLALPLQVVRPKITPGSAWRGARHRASAPEMSTIVRAGEGTGRGLRGTHGRRKWGVESTSGDLRSPPALGGVPGPPSPARPRIACWGGGHTPHSSPPRRPPLIVASSESRSKLTFCTLHYAPPRVPRGRGPAPAPRRQLDWAINLRAPRPPARPRAFVRLHGGRGRPPGRPVCSR